MLLCKQNKIPLKRNLWRVLDIMSFSYLKLWKLAIDRNMNKTELRDYIGITNSTLARLSKNQPVSMEVIGRICEKLDCDINEIVEYVKEDEELYV